MIADTLTAFGPTSSVAAAVVALVFAVAAVAKIRRPVTDELRRLGLPAPGLLAAALPAAELAVVALIALSPRLGSAAAMVMLALFTRVLIRAVVEGHDLSCGCFGSADSRPVTWATVARNGVLLTLATLGTVGVGWTTPDPAALAVVAGVAVIGALAVQLFDLRLSMGRLWSVQLAGEARPDSTSGSSINALRRNPS
ncbi:MAG: MauE/DoxX family redox-associated membrane protein [Actinomycetota bacterium]